MTFGRVKAAGWAMFEVLTAAQMNALDLNMVDAADLGAGGAYAPTAPLEITSAERSYLRTNPAVGYNQWSEDLYGYFTSTIANPRLSKGTQTDWGFGSFDLRGGAYDYTVKAWILVGGSDGCFISYDDGVSFTDYSGAMAVTIPLYDVAAKSGDSRVVAVGADHINNVYTRAAVTSGAWSNGVVPGTNVDLYGVAYDPAADLFVAVGSSGTGTSPYASTADSATLTWTNRSAALPASFAGKILSTVVVGWDGVSAWITLASSRFSSHTKIARSTDGGVTWADCTTSLASDQYDVATSGFTTATFVAVGRNTGKVYTSSDGDTWTLAGTIPYTVMASTNGSCVAYYGQLICVAVTISSRSAIVCSGDGGVTWIRFRPANPAQALANGLIADSYADGNYKLFAASDVYLGHYDRIPS